MAHPELARKTKTMHGPIFVPCDQPSRFSATPAAGGPWSDHHCHGGAPAALLAHIAETQATDTPMSLARFTADLLRPTPIGEPLEVRTNVVRSGRQARSIELELLSGERVLVRATALLVRQTPGSDSPSGTNNPPPADGEHCPMPGGFSQQFTITPSVGGFGLLGPAKVWFRMNSPLIDRQEPNPGARAVASADFASGIAATLSHRDWTFPSLDLTVSFVRPPSGDWILLDSHWLPHAGGRTVCTTLLSDRTGPFAQSTQTLLIDRREAQT